MNATSIVKEESTASPSPTESNCETVAHSSTRKRSFIGTRSAQSTLESKQLRRTKSLHNSTNASGNRILKRAALHPGVTQRKIIIPPISALAALAVLPPNSRVRLQGFDDDGITSSNAPTETCERPSDNHEANNKEVSSTSDTNVDVALSHNQEMRASSAQEDQEKLQL